MHFAAAEFDGERRGEERCVGHEGVVLAVLAARVDTQRLELPYRVGIDAPAEPCLIEARGARGDDDGGTAAGDEFADKRARRFTPKITCVTPRAAASPSIPQYSSV